MRKIKFRAWLKEERKMVNVETLFIGINRLCFGNSKTEDLFFRDFEEVELMQYTGLEDKNSKEIYEGDILFFRDENMKYVVVWQDTAFIIESIEIRKYSEKMYWLDDTEICCEIVGNIYENKNLLEENN